MDALIGQDWKTRIDKVKVARLVKEFGVELQSCKEDGSILDRNERIVHVKKILMTLGVYEPPPDKQVKDFRKVLVFLVHPDKAPSPKQQLLFTEAFKSVKTVIKEIEKNLPRINFTSRGFKSVHIKRLEHELMCEEALNDQVQQEVDSLKAKHEALVKKASSYKEQAGKWKRKYEELEKNLDKTQEQTPIEQQHVTLEQAKAHLIEQCNKVPRANTGAIMFGEQYKLAAYLMGLKCRVVALERKVKPETLDIDAIFEPRQGRRVFYFDKDADVFVRKNRMLQFVDSLLLNKEVKLAKATTELRLRFSQPRTIEKMRLQLILEVADSLGCSY